MIEFAPGVLPRLPLCVRATRAAGSLIAVGAVVTWIAVIALVVSGISGCTSPKFSKIESEPCLAACITEGTKILIRRLRDVNGLSDQLEHLCELHISTRGCCQVTGGLNDTMLVWCDSHRPMWSVWQ